MDQIVAALHEGDATGNEALLTRRLLREAGFASDVFAGRVDPALRGEALALERHAEIARADGTSLFHFAAGSPAGRWAAIVPGRLVVVYHNITPASFFAEWSREMTALAHEGRRELPALASRTELALAKSEFSRRELDDAGFTRTGVLPYLHDLAACEAPGSPVIRRAFGDGHKTLLFVGRVVPNKRIEDLLRAFVIYRRMERRSRLIIVGDAGGQERYLAALRELARFLKLENVVFAGRVEHAHLLAYYDVADAFVCLSEHEGYGVPLVEAMLRGVPVVAYDAGAVGETLQGGGLLLGDKRPEVVAHAVDAVVREGPIRRAVLAAQAAAARRVRALDPARSLLGALRPVLPAVAVPSPPD